MQQFGGDGIEAFYLPLEARSTISRKVTMLSTPIVPVNPLITIGMNMCNRSLWFMRLGTVSVKGSIKLRAGTKNESSRRDSDLFCLAATQSTLLVSCEYAITEPLSGARG